MKQLAAIACACLTGFPAQANDAVAACLTPVQGIEQVTSALAEQGWDLVNLTAMDDETIDHLAWMRVVQFLKTGDGGESRTAIHALQRKAVLGLGRKIDLATSKTRVMRMADRTAFISWRLSPMGPTELDCSFTGLATPQSTDNSTDNIRVTQIPEAGLTITETALGYLAEDL